MSGVLAELGRRFAERWFTLLVLPGLFYAGVAAVAFTLGQRDWADARAVWDGVNALTGQAATDTGGATAAGGSDVTARLVVVLVALVPLSAALGLLAQGLAGPVERVLAGEWPRPLAGLARHLRQRRARRWEAADAALLRCPADDAEARAEAAARRNAIALVPPRRPTWLGDRMYALGARVENEYGLDLPYTWPRLWLLLPEETRGIVAEARRRLDDAFTLGGWAVLYVALGARWWPAAVLGLGAAVAAHRRVRGAAEAYAELVEATVDVHVGRLSRRLGEEPPAPRRGRQISERLRKGA
ncbi:hypothetical protein ACTWP5_16195 [Streptomyces sp. 4N509B]|uniref:hypothetical protein n=1 Tax=Streptomyces sp. 4N509B TaxID=3457413 RepID=UPI003FD4B614